MPRSSRRYYILSDAGGHEKLQFKGSQTSVRENLWARRSCAILFSMILILMGVSGSGKTTIGELLSQRLGWPFYDGDDFHPPANVEKMKQGIPLTDADRAAWLDKIHALILNLSGHENSAIITCSALKESYRQSLTRETQDVRFVFLHGSYPLIASRLQRRKRHFMPPSLLASQFEALEIPSNALQVDISGTPETIVDDILHQLELGIQ